MHSTQAEVQRIQARLQVLGHQRRQTRGHASSPVEGSTPRSSTLTPEAARGGADPRQPPVAVGLPFAASAAPSRSPAPSPSAKTSAPQPSREYLPQPPTPRQTATPGHRTAAGARPSLEVYRIPKLVPSLPRPQPGSTLSPQSASAEDAAQLAYRLRYRQQHGPASPQGGPTYRVTEAGAAKAGTGDIGPTRIGLTGIGAGNTGLQTGPEYLLRWGKRLGRSFNAPLSPPRRVSESVLGAQHEPATHQPSETLADLTLQDAMLWVAASAAARVGLDLLLITYTGLWLPVVALIVAPAAIALYRAAVNPSSGFVLGRRLLLIMIGLLLGGRVL